MCPGRDVKLESGRQRHPSGGVSAKEIVIGLEGVELGAYGKVREDGRPILSSLLCYRSVITSRKRIGNDFWSM